MNLSVFKSTDAANAAAATRLVDWLTAPQTRTIMVAAGNTPIELYRRIGKRGLNLAHLHVFALDEYMGVPLDEPRSCANLLRRSVGAGWMIPPAQFHVVSSLEAGALESVLAHERMITEAGGLDVVVLGLGQNGHLGFNEPGSAEDSGGRSIELEPISIEANRRWFGGIYAPRKGVTVGMKALLAARHILIMAFGAHKSAAVQAMIEGPRSAQCPASFLQGHPDVHVVLDDAAAQNLERAA